MTRFCFPPPPPGLSLAVTLLVAMPTVALTVGDVAWRVPLLLLLAVIAGIDWFTLPPRNRS